MNLRITLFLSVLLAISSCTIEKRLYSRGFHIEFRKPARESNKIIRADGIMEKEYLRINSDSIMNTPVLQEKEQLVPVCPNEKSIPATKSLSGKLKTKIPSGKIRTGVSIQIHFSESLMNKSLKKTLKKHTEHRSRDIDWGEVLDWVLIAGAIIGAIFLLAAMPGISFTQALLGVLIIVILIFIVGLLIGNSLDRVEWFWSGS